MFFRAVKSASCTDKRDRHPKMARKQLLLLQALALLCNSNAMRMRDVCTRITQASRLRTKPVTSRCVGHCPRDDRLRYDHDVEHADHRRDEDSMSG